MKRSWLLLILMLCPWRAHAFSLWAEESFAPLGEYLGRPFDNFSVCVDRGAGALNAAEMHFLGAPKQVSRRLVAYNDDGSVEMDSRTVIHFLRNGSLLDSVSSSEDKGAYAKVVWKYDDLHRLSEIAQDLPILDKQCVAKFFYDGRGLVSRIVRYNSDFSDNTIVISRLGDGRPREAIERRSTGQADWRLSYTYSAGATTIDRYAHDQDNDRHETSTFEFDAAKRVVHVLAQTETSEVEETGDFHLRYLQGGIVVVHAAIMEHGKPCIYDYSLHHNGDVDLQSIHVWGEQSLLCHEPAGGDERYRTYFDRKGNIVGDRGEHDVMELGRTVSRPKSLITNAISYY